MGAVWPEAVREWSANHRDNVPTLEEWNEVLDEVEALEEFLGINPQGDDETLADRVERMDTQLALLGNVGFRNLRIDPNLDAQDTDVTILIDEILVEGYLVRDVDLNVDITASGALGLDTGSEASSTWYGVWVGWNPETEHASAILSASFTRDGITLDSSLDGYTAWRLIGPRYNGSGGHLRRISQRDAFFWFMDEVPIGGALAADNAWHEADADDCVEAWPPICGWGLINGSVSAPSVNCGLRVAPITDETPTGVMIATAVSGGLGVGQSMVPLDENRQFQWKGTPTSTGTPLRLNAIGGIATI